MVIILIPGLWLDGSSWEKVVPVLEQAGHRPHPLTLPGMEAQDVDRSGITLRDHVTAVIAAIDAVDPADGKVVLVGHSWGGAVISAAAAGNKNVKSLVFVAAFAPEAGEVVTKTRDAASRQAGSITAAVEAGKKAYTEEKRKTELSGRTEAAPTYKPEKTM